VNRKKNQAELCAFLNQVMSLFSILVGVKDRPGIEYAGNANSWRKVLQDCCTDLDEVV